MRSRTHRTPITRWLAVALAMLLVLPAMVHPAAAQRPAPGDRLDLPGAIISPLDLHAMGIPGFGVANSAMFHTTGEALDNTAGIASRGNTDIRKMQGIDQVLATSGWLQFHEQLFGKTISADTDDLSDVISVGIEQYATPDGAAAGFAAFTSEETLTTATTAITHQALQPMTPLGDEAVAWIHDGHADHENLEEQGITLMVRVDTVIMSVTHLAYRDGSLPDQATIERVMQRQIDRVAAAQSSGPATGCLPSPAGGLCTQRIHGTLIHANGANYRVRDGVATPYFASTPEAHLQRQADVTASNIVAEYTTRYSVAETGYVYHELITLPDAASAAQHHADLFSVGPYAGDAPQTEIAVPGATEAATVYMTSPSGATHWTISHARVENVVILVRISNRYGSLPDIGEELLTSQVACMQAGNCLTPVEISYERFG